MKRGDKEKNDIELILMSLSIPYVKEHRFHDVRRFKFDYAIVDSKIAIEYEGLFSKKSGHTTISGYTKDCDKYNLALVNGWKVLRYTALNYKNLLDDIKFLWKS